MKTILLMGARGRLGRALHAHFRDRFKIRVLGRRKADFARADTLRKTLVVEPFDILIICAALTDVDYCETHVDEANRINGYALADLAWAARQFGARIIHLSTDYVFDGKKREPYVETDPPSPISKYGASKLLGEDILLEDNGPHIIIRTSWLFGMHRPVILEENILTQQFRGETEAGRVDCQRDRIRLPP